MRKAHLPWLSPKLNRRAMSVAALWENYIQIYRRERGGAREEKDGTYIALSKTRVAFAVKGMSPSLFQCLKSRSENSLIALQKPDIAGNCHPTYLRFLHQTSMKIEALSGFGHGRGTSADVQAHISEQSRCKRYCMWVQTSWMDKRFVWFFFFARGGGGGGWMCTKTKKNKTEEHSSDCWVFSYCWKKKPEYSHLTVFLSDIKTFYVKYGQRTRPRTGQKC